MDGWVVGWLIKCVDGWMDSWKVGGWRNSLHFSSLRFRCCSPGLSWTSLVAQLVKNPPAMQETLVQFLGQEEPLEKQ